MMLLGNIRVKGRGRPHSVSDTPSIEIAEKRRMIIKINFKLANIP